MVTAYLRTAEAELPIPVSFFLGGILLWDLVFRAKNSVALCLLEENHSRNVISVMASPVTPGEYLAGAVIFGLGKIAVTWTIMAALAWILFAFGVLTLGPMVALYACLLLLFAMALALVVIGVVLRFSYSCPVSPSRTGRACGRMLDSWPRSEPGRRTCWRWSAC